MKQQDFLYNLVQSLTKSEKRHFRLFSSFQSGDKTYLSLFDQFERARTAEAAEDKPTETNPNHFSVAKGYLNNQILKSLRNYHAAISITARIQSDLHDVDILFRKGLIEQAHKWLRKAHKLALKYERFGLLLEILTWERRLNIVSNNPSREESSVYQETRDVLARLDNIIEYQSRYNQLIEFKQRWGYLRGENDQILEAIMSSPLMQGPEHAISARARFYYHLILSNYYYLVAEYEKGHQASRNLVNSDAAALDHFEFLEGTLEHVSSCIFYDQLGEALYYLNQVREIGENSPIGRFDQVQVKSFYFRANYEMMIFLDTAQIDRLREKVVEVEEGLDLLAGKLTREMEYLLWGALANRHFFLGNLKRARHWNNQVLNAGKKKVRADIYNAARFLHLFLLVESEQHDLLTYELKSTLRHFRTLHRNHADFGIELIVCDMMADIPTCQTQKDLANLALRMEQSIRESCGPAYELRLREEFDTLKYWLESKQTGRPKLELIKEQAMELVEFEPG